MEILFTLKELTYVLFVISWLLTFYFLSIRKRVKFTKCGDISWLSCLIVINICFLDIFLDIMNFFAPSDVITSKTFLIIIALALSIIGIICGCIAVINAPKVAFSWAGFLINVLCFIAPFFLYVNDSSAYYHRGESKYELGDYQGALKD